ncbi:PD40 domain-containing protein, partial [bacterium]|nr:PD40 domain-containing protein [bacterium]
MRKIVLPFIVLIFLLTSVVFSQTPTKLLRFPAIYENQIVFTYAGNLYTVPANGGTARLLTSHDGYEMFARFSPDGQTIAFTGQYDGNTEVFVMPAEGGAPERLTYTATLGRDDVSDRMGPNNIVMGWAVDGKKVIFRSRMHEFNSFKGQLYTVGLKGEVPEQLPFSHGGFCSFAPDGKKFAYNSVFREFRTWKRYRGGMADDIRIFDFDTQKTVKITNNDAQDIYPMWKENKIYFLSDRDANKRMNLFCYDTKTEETRKLTNFADFDIKFPSLGQKAIVFEYGGEIYRFDLATEKAEKIEIAVIGDKLGQRMVLKDLSKNIRHWSPSPDGKRALFGARGEIFTVPVKHGVTRNLTKTSDVHERNCTWSPDGKWIAYISDETG